ncbi:transposase [Leucobacter chromiireducens]|uniref:transposase n=1 Tax=Leucobacter chromiireducens TaxID=283877 RepID=UPI001F153A98|nr:transposase [Leucobacter chromiireducens]
MTGEDYPRTMQELQQWFPDDAACLRYLERLRRSEGFSCPRCRGAEYWVAGDGLRICRSCQRRTSVTAGTIFHRTRSPLQTWFMAAWFITSQKNGMSAQSLQRVLGFGLVNFAQNNVVAGATIHTDGARMMRRLADMGYTHEYATGYNASEPEKTLPGVHLVASLLKRWLTGTLHYGISPHHLPYYLDEFTFRFNRRAADHRGLLFYRLLQQAVDADPHPLDDLLDPEHNPNLNW